jgi:hypothetical protein
MIHTGLRYTPEFDERLREERQANEMELMEQAANDADKLEEMNKQYLDLYGDSLKQFISLPANATFEDIKEVVKSNNAIGYQHNIKIGDKCVIAERKFTWKGNTAKTSYLHIFVINNFEDKKVIEHWREQSNGNFKTI